jgi:beta-glucanase (GH16 family)
LWPPEIDFNESGGSNSATSSTLHYGTTNLLDQRQLSINLTQWHTWGVIWTPSTVKYIVNGQVWGSISVRTEIANVPMTLDMEQRDLCQIGLQCPTKPESMLIDWVAEYQPS